MRIPRRLKKLVNKIFKDPKFANIWQHSEEIALTGSYANGTETINSDIDIIIISEYLSIISSETFLFGNIIIHLIFMPYYKIQDIIIDEFYNGSKIYSPMIQKSIILKSSSDNIIKNMKIFLNKNLYETRNDMIESALVHTISKELEILNNNTDTIGINIIASAIICQYIKTFIGTLSDGLQAYYQVS